jgi:hypothetical protein
MRGILSITAFLVVAGGLVFTIFGIPLLAAWVLLMVLGAAGREQRALENLRSTLMTEESLEASGVQMRPLALFNRRIVVGITNSRIIFIRRGLLGGFKMSDIQWKDLRDVRLEQNVLSALCGSNLDFFHRNLAVGHMAIPGAPSDTASTIYTFAQAQEQSWEEKRRVRGMEEVRAAAGGVVVHAAPSQAAGSSPARSLAAQIQEAKALLDSGTVSDAEFQEMKSKILSGPSGA